LDATLQEILTDVLLTINEAVAGEMAVAQPGTGGGGGGLVLSFLLQDSKRLMKMINKKTIVNKENRISKMFRLQNTYLERN
jgi:hypothetical protein